MWTPNLDSQGLRSNWKDLSSWEGFNRKEMSTFSSSLLVVKSMSMRKLSFGIKLSHMGWIETCSVEEEASNKLVNYAFAYISVPPIQILL